MSQVIILNGPPGCGKDTIGQLFSARNGLDWATFKYPMFKIAASTLGMSYDDFYDCYQDREWKESPQERLNGHTVREFMIHISETFVKPFLGQDYFGHQALEYINQRPWANGFLFTDGGFPMEVDVLANAGHEVVLVHMYRDGTDFSNDSRSYVLTNSVSHIYTLNNNGTVDEAVENLERILDEIRDRNATIPDEREVVSDDSVPLARAQPAPRPRRERGFTWQTTGAFSGQISGAVTASAEARVNAGRSSQQARDIAAILEHASARMATQPVRGTEASFAVMDESEPMSEGLEF